MHQNFQRHNLNAQAKFFGETKGTPDRKIRAVRDASAIVATLFVASAYVCWRN